MFEVSADGTPVNYPEWRGDIDKSVSKATIANYERNKNCCNISNPLKDL